MPAEMRRADGAYRLTVRVAMATEMLGIGKTKLYELIANGEIDTIKAGSATLIILRSLEAFIERQRRAPTPMGGKRRRGRPRKTFAELAA